jgi:hypothetical protein
MRQLVYIVLWLSVHTISTSHASINYQQLLPTVSEKNPDLMFVKSRDLGCLSAQFLEIIESTFQPYNFVEINMTDSTGIAAQIFPQVYTLEPRTEIFEKESKRFAQYSNVHLKPGNLNKTVAYLLSTLEDKTVIVLNKPTYKDLARLEKIIINDNTIIILDDARLLYQPIASTKNTFVEQYPTLEYALEKLLAINPHYQCALIYDALIFFDKNENITVSPLVRAATLSRLYNDKNFETNELLEAELCIAHAQDKEMQTLEDLALAWTDTWSKAAGFSRHLPLWHGLMCLAHDNFPKAHAQFKEAKERGITTWRIDWYLAMAETGCFFGIK